MKEDTTTNEIRKGLLVVAVLQVIGRRRSYAGEILTLLTSTGFSTQEGTLYPLLSRLKREGLIDHEWVESKNGPPRKYYKLNSLGKTRLRKLMDYINEINKDLARLGENNE